MSDHEKLQDKRRRKAERLQNPKPVELPSGKWRCQVMVNGERISVVDDDPEIAHAKVLAQKAGLIQRTRTPKEITVGEAIDRYIESKDAVLSPSTIGGYKRIRENALQGIMDIKLSALTREKVQREVNSMAKTKSPKTIRNAHGLLSAALAEYYPDLVLKDYPPAKGPLRRKNTV